jgi:hypothetical protein
MPRDVFTPETIGPELIATDKRIRQAAIRGLRQAARLGRGEVVKEIRGNKPFPLVDLGELLRSPKVTNIDDGAILVVTAPHGTYQEFGTGPAAGNAPFTPPLEAIQQWTLRKARRSSRRRKGKGGRASAKTKGQAPKDPVQQALGESASFTRKARKHVAASRDLLRTREQRERSKAKRRAAKAKRDAATSKDALAMAGAVWVKMRREGMQGKRYYQRASERFQGHVDKRVAATVAKVSR